MMNAVDPDRMTAAERLDEVGDILAAGVQRLRNKSSKFNGMRDVSLDFPEPQSVHGREPDGNGD